MRNVYIQSKNIKKIRNVFFTIVLILGSYFVLETYFSEVLNLLIARFENQGSGEERIKSWIAGFNLLETNFFFGIGPTNYANIIGDNFHASIAEGSREAHNMFIKVLVESGFFGFIPFILIVYNRLKIIVFKKKEHIFTLMFICVLLMGLTLSLTYEKYTWLIFALLFNPSIYSLTKGKNKL